MKWKTFTFYLTIALTFFIVAICVNAKNSSQNNDSGPPDEPAVLPKFINMTGTVKKVVLYELKETLTFYDYINDKMIEKLIPVDEPDELYFLTIAGDQIVDEDNDGIAEFNLKDGDQWLLDFGPEWYAPDPCLVDSYICDDEDGLIKVGPFTLGVFTCVDGLTAFVESNDIFLDPPANDIKLMSRDKRNNLPGASEVYVFGRSGGSEIVWIWDDPQDNIDGFVRYPKAGSNIVWEINPGGPDGQLWWRGEAPPQAMTNELNCSTTEY